MTTHVFLRHFEKRPHPLALPPRLIAALPASMARVAVFLWRALDRHAVGLSREGRRAGWHLALRLSEALRDRGIAPSRIIASPYRRTRQSAKILAEIFAVPVAYDERLVEWDLGARSGCDFEAFSRAFPTYRETVEREGYLYVPAPHARESHAAAREGRVRAFLADLGRQESAIVVAHYSILDSIAQVAYGWTDEEMMERMAALRGARYGEGFFVDFSGGKIAATGEFRARELR